MKESCLLKGSCQVERSIYQATVTCDDDPTYGEKFYIGLAEPKLKKNFSPTIKLHFVTNVTKKRQNSQKRFGGWKERTLLAGRLSRNVLHSRECNLCLNEKLEISTFTINGRLFNSRNELISKCRHVNKFTMKSYTILKIDVSDTTALYFIFAILNVSLTSHI